MEGNDPDWTWIMPKVTAAIVALTALLLVGLTGCAGSTDDAGDESGAPVVTGSATPEGSAAPLVAQDPEGEGNEAFLEFVRGRLATFPSQIPDATDEQLIAAGLDACSRVEAGESVDKMSVIEGEEPSEVGGYFYDSNAIIAGAQMHLCPPS